VCVGALQYRLRAAEPEAPTHPTVITPDPWGPLLVRGDLVLDTPEGPLRETRAALCAWGRTQNQPFCDGACGVNAGPPGGTRDQAETSPQ
jgi:Iron-binding zinc finger CDGSH type